MSETLSDTVDTKSSASPAEVETVFHGTSPDTAKTIIESGFKPEPHVREPELGPITWFNTESLIASGYGHEPAKGTSRGDVTEQLLSFAERANKPLYGAVIEAEIPKSTDTRGYRTHENGIEYFGTTRLVTLRGMSRVAIKAVRLYEYKPTASGVSSVHGRIIDERRFDKKQPLLERIHHKIRRKRNEIAGKPTL